MPSASIPPVVKWLDREGYVQLTRCGKTVREHTVVAEAAFGGPLPRGVHVHHLDGDGTNNTPSNLVICSAQYHHLIHAHERVRRAGGNPLTERWCYRCLAFYPKSNFHKLWRTYDGLNTLCKPCARERTAFYKSKRLKQQPLGVGHG